MRRDSGAPGDRVKWIASYLQHLLIQAWESPTIMTWASFGSQSMALILVLPLVLTKLSPPDIALWYLFTTIIRLQMLADLGFSPTFVRVIAYAMGGARLEQIADLRTGSPSKEADEPNWSGIEQICATMRVVYNRLTIAAMAGLLTFGTLAVVRPISLSIDRTSAWLAWGVVLLGSAIALRGNYYSAYLQGVNQVAVLRRWEAIAGLASVLASSVVLLLGGGLLSLIISNQLFMALAIFRNRWVSGRVESGRFNTFSTRIANPTVLAAVWPSAWRSGIGTLMGQAPVRFTGVFYAQVGSPEGIAVYLFALRLFTAIRSFSMAPFYSKLPVFSRLRAQNRLVEQMKLAQKGMRMSHWTFTGMFVAGQVFGPQLSTIIGSNIPFPEPALWGLLGLAMFIERFGAMHLQLYSTTNHITWHIVNGVTGLIFIASAALMFPRMDVYAFPAAYLLSYLTFYSLYSTRLSYRSLSVGFWNFETKVFVAPAIVTTAFAVYWVATGWRDL